MSKCDQCIVRQFNSLKHLSKEDLMRMSNCKTSKIIKKGEPIFEEGDYLNGVYCIKDGVCKISKMSENGKNQIINIIKRGDLIGERSLISEEVSNLNAIALEDMEVCFIPRDEIVRDLEKNPAFTMDILKTMASSLKNSDNLIVDMAQKSVKQRLAETLLKLQTKFGVNEIGAIDIQLSREDIANIIGTATESAIRLLSEFKKNKSIGFKGKNIIIINKNDLEKIANGF
ncbi:MAG: Crp/Fnr family transcriptional regulator [Flavobacteriia bacterium]|nr:Crp/Fnr family transcriptional regulator [Flavobacteriia bacterium]OIP45104.1 MAG: Crp/Fnr family transcriptional regulator [Flavobacteriaceae bacterium CG2_30_31_66]PIV95300.1 MAG: Crp/Fnr family transcriptional regulator [Flavobacteriaceae bacterium CG17_big_fil_post_rev_8_21_14_2_50_31_13]PIX14808.1 MAG: Crp/Fnr family transcriptional regulator [Flavobacteriaceae bacterium CG_4_8_14_3_um_filter_31_8]PIY13631.1 MAG: Crp/Fnr family transcriptional regulator [Flavobacteriaceae bacterium CG_4